MILEGNYRSGKSLSRDEQAIVNTLTYLLKSSKSKALWIFASEANRVHWQYKFFKMLSNYGGMYNCTINTWIFKNKSTLALKVIGSEQDYSRIRSLEYSDLMWDSQVSYMSIAYAKSLVRGRKWVKKETFMLRMISMMFGMKSLWRHLTKLFSLKG